MVFPYLIYLLILALLAVGQFQASPNNSSVCVPQSSQYPLKPGGECINNATKNEEITVWEYVNTTKCCRNTLNAISQVFALSINSTNNKTIFPSKQVWNECSSHFLNQDNINCKFDNLYKENGQCSQLTVTSFSTEYGDLFNSTLNSCAEFGTSTFGDRCRICSESVSGLIENVIDNLGVRGNTNEEEVCSIAAVTSVASADISNGTWVDDFYRCLPILDFTVEARDPAGRYYKVPRGTVKEIFVILVAGLGMVLLVLLIKLVIRQNINKPAEGKVISKWSGLYRFSKAEIEKAINYGNSKVSLGSGSAGRVYQGVLPSGQLVAIKHIYKTAMSDSFTREVERLSKIRHPNLVCLLGCCDENGEQYLVYEYCSNGNLAQNLLRSERVLPWDRRVRILKDCALGLKFLHTHPDGCIVHRDIKLTNILLTETMEPKLSDFGLARLLKIEESKVFTDVRGTIGYMDPEYMTNAKLTCASDVYSFGIVALQLLSGRKVIELDIEARESLTTKAKDVANGRRPLTDFVDPRLNGELNLKDFESILRVAVLCVASSSRGRPTTKDVYDEMNRAWKNTLPSKMRALARRDNNMSMSQSLSTDIEV